MNRLVAFNSTLERYFGNLMALLFAGLIGVVLMQVVARNVLHVPLIWTLDLAQLLFSWCIFIGAGLAFRHGGHYVVNIWPNGNRLDAIPTIVAMLASAIVIHVLIWNGIAMSRIGMNRFAPALGISEFWFFLPIPIGGTCMALFLLEQIWQAATGGGSSAPGAITPDRVTPDRVTPDRVTPDRVTPDRVTPDRVGPE